MSLTYPIAGPTYAFFTGIISAAPDVPELLPVSIGGRSYLVDTPNIRRETIDVLRPAIDTSAEPGQQSLNTAGMWSVIAADWRHGAGQKYLDSRESNPRMYYSSKGLDPWTTEELHMQPDTREILSLTTGTLLLTSIGNELWASGGTTLKRTTSSPVTTTVSWSTVTVNAPLSSSNCTSVTTDGTRIYTAHGTNGVGRAAKGASAISQWSTYDASLVAYANGRLLAWKTGSLVELDSAGAAGTAIWTGGIGGDAAVVDIVGTPDGILVAYNSDDRGEVLFIGLDTTDGSLAVPLFAGELNKGETFNELTYYNGLLLAGTSRGLRLGRFTDSQRGVSFGPVLDLGPVAGIAPWGQFAWFIWNNYDGTSHGLGRVDLSTFTELLVPAYASDLMVPLATGSISSLVTHVGYPIMGISGAGVYAQHPTDLVDSARLESGYLRFGTYEKKIVIGADVRHQALAGRIDLALCDETGTETPIGWSDIAGSLGSSLMSGGGVEGEAIQGCLTFTVDGAGTAGPVLRRWTVYAVNVPRRVEQIDLPLVVRTEVLNHQGVPIAYDPLDEYHYLKGLEANRAPVPLVMGDKTDTVIVDKVGIAPERWATGNHWLEGIVMVRCLQITVGE